MLRLVGAREIEVRLGVSRQRVQQLADRADFPAPFHELTMGRVWWAHEVEAWIRDRRPGEQSGAAVEHGSEDAARQLAERVADHLAERSHAFLGQDRIDVLADLLHLFLDNSGFADEASSENAGAWRTGQGQRDSGVR
ncbi:hypothetical protein [Actinoplanes sp. NBRC 101535]|uniref:helix-turn-helix transcriptional regulator n=1 Tax=Actinoplanes sp. NBRC 101535 TaxID=3032196 RepID=UPI00333D2474